MTSPIIIVIGTRPEGIKMLPVYFALKKAHVPVLLCSTNQHSDLLQEVYKIFEVIPDIDLDIMRPSQDLFHITTSALSQLKIVFKKINPLLVLLQGDTTSGFAATLAAYYLHIAVGHVEAGLRTYDLYNPFPEEMNRRFISLIARYHFAPTAHNVHNLMKEGIEQHAIYCTGNTVVDALQYITTKINSKSLLIDNMLERTIESARAQSKKIFLLTTHRRESFNGGITTILSAVRDFAKTHPQVIIIYPFHPNPCVREAIQISAISGVENVYMTSPLAYKDLVYVLLHAHCVVTDSGGLLEEAVSLGKKVLIVREKTERPESLIDNRALLCGVSYEHILHHLKNFMTTHDSVLSPSYLYGTGHAAQTIAQIVAQQRPFLLPPDGIYSVI